MRYKYVVRERKTMASSTRRKDRPLSMRLPDADIAIIDRAAALRGRSRTEFVRDAAVRAAEATLLENAPLRMSEEGFAAFLAAIASPGEAGEEMVALLRRRAPWEAKPSES
jgi:uncharacterized protein (DUF1778 family)